MLSTLRCEGHCTFLMLGLGWGSMVHVCVRYTFIRGRYFSWQLKEKNDFAGVGSDPLKRLDPGRYITGRESYNRRPEKKRSCQAQGKKASEVALERKATDMLRRKDVNRKDVLSAVISKTSDKSEPNFYVQKHLLFAFSLGCDA